MPRLKVAHVAASFVDLCHYAWGVPVLAVLASDGGAKLITVANRLRLAPETARRTVRALTSLDLVMPNPGYGHPMRPEYILAPDGEAVGRETAALWTALEGRSEGLRAACRRKWTLPTIVVLERGAERFTEIATALAGVSPRALAQTIETLLDARLVEREIDEGPPVRTRYQLTTRGVNVGRFAEQVDRAFAGLSPETD